MMVGTQHTSLSIANSNMNPRELFSSVLWFDCFGLMSANNLTQLAKSSCIISLHPSVWIQAFLTNTIDRFASLILHDREFKALARVGWTALLARFRGFGFGHNKNRCLLLTSTTTFKLRFSIPSILRINSTKESFVYFNHTGQCSSLIPSSHGRTDLLHHVPNWFISFVPLLTLHFFRRDWLFHRGHQMNGYKPGLERKIRVFHNRSLSQGGSGSAFFALKLLYALHPVVFCAATFSALKTLSESVIPKAFRQDCSSGKCWINSISFIIINLKLRYTP
jgi:hypothetical protein